jgi:hypothetical protein
VIFQALEDRLLTISQAAHGAQTGAFARHWGNEHTPGFDWGEAVIQAASHHDDGWIAWEASPAFDPVVGHPCHFYQLSPHEHIPLYRRGIQMAVSRHPVTGLLVSMHGAGLYNGRYASYRLIEPDFDDSEHRLVSEFLEEQGRLQGSLSKEIEDPAISTPPSQDPRVMYTYLLLQVWDRLSLQFAFYLAADGEITPLPHPDGTQHTLSCKNDGAFALRLDPYPFDNPQLTFPIEVRYLPQVRYQQIDEFMADMKQAPVETIECRVRAS